MRIPAPLIAALSNVIPEYETHASMDALFLHADAPGDPPEGNKQAKTQAWLRRANKVLGDPLSIVGPLIEGYMEADTENEWLSGAKAKLEKALNRCNLVYVVGGHVTAGGSLPSIGLADLIRGGNFAAVEEEFQRALENLNKDPREAASAAGNILESACKIYIEDNGLEMPAKKDLKSVWAVVRKNLKFDPKNLIDDDLKKDC